MKKTYIEVNKWNAQKIIQTMETGEFDPLYIRELKDWGILSRYGKIPENLIDKYAGYWDWVKICFYQTLSEQFIREHISYIGPISMKTLCARQKLSIEFIRDFKDTINWFGLSRNKHLTNEIKEEFNDKLAAYLEKSALELIEDGIKP